MLKCPNCNSSNLTPITEIRTTTHSKGFGFCKACIGWLILGPFGLLCGLCGMKQSVHTSTRQYWACHGCGHKFKHDR